MQVGIVGLGRMGSRIAKKFHKDGHGVVVWNRSNEDVESLKKEIPNLKSAKSIKDLVQNLQKPRIIWSMVPAGDATDEVLKEVSKYVEKGDIVVDGGNAFYKDTEERYKNFKKNGVKFLGIGVSGGVYGEKNGYSLMVGGEKSAYDYVAPILKTLSSPSGAYDFLGVGGAGHFVKMVHNGIEYGMMQSIGEGFDVLKNSPYNLNLSKVAKVWGKGAIVSGFLMERTADVLSKDRQLKGIVGSIEATGEAQWTVQTAKEEGIDVQVIQSSLDYRKRSKTDKKIQNSFTAKIIASLRNVFGDHEVKKK